MANPLFTAFAEPAEPPAHPNRRFLAETADETYTGKLIRAQSKVSAYKGEYVIFDFADGVNVIYKIREHLGTAPQYFGRPGGEIFRPGALAVLEILRLVHGPETLPDDLDPALAELLHLEYTIDARRRASKTRAGRHYVTYTWSRSHGGA